MIAPQEEPNRHRYQGGRHRPENAVTDRVKGGSRVRRGICRVCGRPKAVHPYRTDKQFRDR